MNLSLRRTKPLGALGGLALPWCQGASRAGGAPRGWFLSATHLELPSPPRRILPVATKGGQLSQTARSGWKSRVFGTELSRWLR